MIDVETKPTVQQLMRDLHVLGQKIERSGVRAGLREVSKPIMAKQKAWAQSHRSNRQEPGRVRMHLADSINAVTFSARNMGKLAATFGSDFQGGILTLMVGPNKNAKKKEGTAYVGRFLNYGTKDEGRKRGIIKPLGRKKALHPGGDVFWARAKHKGVRATGWIDNSADGVAIDQLFYKGLQAFIDKQAEAK